MRLLAPFLVLLGVLAAAVYLDHSPTRADVVFVNRGDTFTLDPQRMSYMQDLRMAAAIYEGLLRLDSADCSILPAAAASWTVSDDKLTYHFTLRRDGHWSNGDPVTAHDFVWSWQRAMLPDTAADYSSLFFLIDGAEDFFTWRTEQLAAFASLGAGDDAAAARLWELTQQRFSDTVGLSAPDDHTLIVRLRAPTAYFADLATFGTLSPAHRPTVEGWPTDDPKLVAKLAAGGWHSLSPAEVPDWPRRRWVSLDPRTGRLEQHHDWTKPPLLVSNGPYILTQWRYRRDMRLEANPCFHSPEMLRNRSVTCLSINDANTGVLAYESGQIDWLSDVGAEYQSDMLAERRAYEQRNAAEIARMRAQGASLNEALGRLPPPKANERRNIHVFPAFGTDFFSFNCRPMLADGRVNPFADPRVRRAFALSIDKNAIVHAATRLDEPIATTIVPTDTIPGYHSPAGLPFDPARARAELLAAGWADRRGDGVIRNERGEPFPVVDLLYTTNSPRYKNMSLVLSDGWQNHLGVKVEIRSEDTKFYKDEIKHGNFMIARGGWYGDYGDPTTFLSLCRTGDGNNDRGYSNPYFDGLLDKASREPDADKRLRMLEEAERFLCDEELPILPMCRFVQTYMYEPGTLTGLSDNPRLIQYLWQLKVEDPRGLGALMVDPHGGTGSRSDRHSQLPPGRAGG